MASKTFFLSVVLILFTHVTSHEISFTLVVDTTVSMQNELDSIRNVFTSMFNSLSEEVISKFKNYIVVPFKDPDVQTPIISNSREGFAYSLNSLTASQGGECPKNSMAALQKGMEVSEMGSVVYLFTDAYANDPGKVEDVKRICSSKNIQVVILLTGKCPADGDENPGDVKVYSELAQYCSGMMFNLDTNSHILTDTHTLKKAYRFIDNIIKTEYNSVETKLIRGQETLNLEITPNTVALMISMTGIQPSISYMTPNRQKYEFDSIFSTTQARSDNIIIKPGTLVVNVNSYGSSVVSIYKKTKFPFRYGFSRAYPRSLRETSRRPLPGWENNILIEVSKDANIQVDGLLITYLDGTNDKNLALEQSNTKTYIGNLYFLPKVQFQITILATNSDTLEHFKVTSDVLEPQREVTSAASKSPVVEMLDENKVVDYGKDTIIACKVTGYPKPTITWTTDTTVEHNVEEVLLEIPSVYISYYRMSRVKENGNYRCSAINSIGSNSGEVRVEYHREYAIEVIRKPEDQKIEYGQDGTIYCEVDAYPEATISWYFGNQKLVSDYTDYSIDSTDHSLVIKNMVPNKVGTYTCQVQNNIKTKRISCEIGISGVEMPLLDVTGPTELYLKENDFTKQEIECVLKKGKPEPKLTWEFMTASGDSSALPKQVEVEGSKLKITTIARELNGVFRCTADNGIGSDYRDIVVNVLTPPIITSDFHPVTLKARQELTLKCEVDSNPPSTVYWETPKKEYRNVQTLSFYPIAEDTGLYKCIAKNELGQAVKEVYVDVLDEPYIDDNYPKKMYATVGQTVTLPCSVTGNPKPTVTWQFKDKNSRVTMIKKRNTKSDSLTLEKVEPHHNGSYICRASNPLGYCKININLYVLPENIH